VHSIARQTIRASASLDDFAAEFEGRLRALSRVQGLLARVDHGAIDLRELVTAELHAHGDGSVETGKVTIDGPSAMLPAASAQALGLAIHELATNAVKHGALKQSSGKLAVTWRIEDGGQGEPRVLLEWRESGVQMSEQERRSARAGYGSELIRHALPYQLKAETNLELGPDGVRCRIAALVERAEASHG
jgi:two-component sensor histidine kinase